MAETVVPVAGDVKGDITACKIETVKKSVDRKGAFSFTQKENYVTYDVCTKQIVTEYSTKTVTGGGLFVVCLAAVVLIVAAVMASDFYY